MALSLKFLQPVQESNKIPHKLIAPDRALALNEIYIVGWPTRGVLPYGERMAEEISIEIFPLHKKFAVHWNGHLKNRKVRLNSLEAPWKVVELSVRSSFGVPRRAINLRNAARNAADCNPEINSI
jgi:hypothetical protein